MSDREILALIRSAVAETVPDKSAVLDGIAFDAPLADFGLDSIGLIETAAHIEEALGIDFPDDQLARVDTVADFAALIRARLPGPPGDARQHAR